MPNVLTQEIKDLYIARALKHKEADAFIQGSYWDGDKGCCVGCLAEAKTNPHEELSRDLSVPKWLFYLADKIHEGLPSPDYKKWPLRFMQAMPIGLDADAWSKKIEVPFLLIVLNKALTTFNHDMFPDCKKAISDVIDLYERGEMHTERYKAAASAAYDAAYDAAGNAAYAAGAAAAYAADAAATYGDAVAAAAARVAYAARVAHAARVGYEAARAAHYESWQYFADALIQLMENENNAQQNA